LVRDRKTGKELALKKLQLSGTDGDSADKAFLREVQGLIAIDHPCVLAINGIALPMRGVGSRILTAFMRNGSLADWLEKADKGTCPAWTRTVASIVIIGTAHGMQCVNAAGLIHRDLKPANVLLDHKMRPRIFDFGCAISDEASVSQTSTVGTYTYMAPEMHTGGDKRYTTQIDVFAFGLMVYEIVFGLGAFSGTLYRIAEQCTKGTRPSL